VQTPIGKIILIVLDGVGIGALPDAQAYGDEGSNTLSHTARAVGGLHLPCLEQLGLGNLTETQGISPAPHPTASYGKLTEVSAGKDSTTGHWELAGFPVEKAFPTYPEGFPEPLLLKFVQETGCAGWLGNIPASGTAIIAELGGDHLQNGKPIVYTSADSVFQIAAHESVIPLERLYDICRVTRERVCIGPHAVSRVIARPFVGTPGHFTRTSHRRDFSVVPGGTTVLDLLLERNIPTTGVGKIDDLFAGRGLAGSFHTTNNADGIAALRDATRKNSSGFFMANLGDFDTLYGHRNDPNGFARALEAFDKELPSLLETVGPRDVLMITADHGNDPTTTSTDHSREYVPLLAFAPGSQGRPLGTRRTFADVGSTVAEYFGVSGDIVGTSFLGELRG
jgi:phosphopentomutase